MKTGLKMLAVMASAFIVGLSFCVFILPFAYHLHKWFDKIVANYFNSL